MLRRIICLLPILFLGNIPFMIVQKQMAAGFIYVVGALGIVWYLIFQVMPVYSKGVSFRIQILSGGYELLWNGAVGLLSEEIILVVLWSLLRESKERVVILVVCGIFTAILMVISICNGVLRMVIASGQLKFFWKAMLLTTMWIPLWNFYLLWKACNTVHKEYVLESELQQQDILRCEAQICCTKYPIVMVHGIFFRDWQLLNYWGRIPGELKRNGSVVFYGKQESALPVAQSALEVKRHILEAIEQTGAEKVNIIAHSKGGLDARYAISCLGMSGYVASLTTINTPHRGCQWAEQLLDKLPHKLIEYIAKKYNRIFRILGDQEPDFYEAVKDLTQSRCQSLNEQMPDAESVYYQSVMSVMEKRRSAGFPLNLTYGMVRKKEGENDGLVSLPSAKWGRFLGVLRSGKRRGISHADMIDLTRENIDGFHVRAYYVDLVKDLKNLGF